MEPFADLIANLGKICLLMNFYNKLPSDKPPPCIYTPKLQRQIHCLFHMHSRIFCRLYKANENSKISSHHIKKLHMGGNSEMNIHPCFKYGHIYEFFFSKIATIIMTSNLKYLLAKLGSSTIHLHRTRLHLFTTFCIAHF